MLGNITNGLMGDEQAIIPEAYAAPCGYDDALFENLSDAAKADLQKKESEGNCGNDEPVDDDEVEDLVEEAQDGTFQSIRANIKPPSDAPEEVQNKVLDEVAETAMKAHGIFAPMINFAAFQIGNFLNNDYIYFGSMGDMLQNIWVISRNLVNIIFVFILLWLAVKTIFVPDGGLDDLKKSLLKFVLLLIAVNFSWLGTKVILDAASVGTQVVFAIPSGISNGPQYENCQVNTNAQQPLKGMCYPTKIFAPTDSGGSKVLYFQDKEGDDDHCAAVEAAYDDLYDEDGNEKVPTDEANEIFRGRMSMCMESLNLTKYEQSSSVIYMTYGMARIQNLVDAMGSGDSKAQLAVGVLMSMILQLVYMVALLALLVALIFRMMALWLLVAGSPVLVLLFWFGESGGGDGLKRYFSFDQFIKWAFVPVKVGIIFAVTFIMISAGQAIGNFRITSEDNGNGLIQKILEPEALFSGVGSLQSLIWFLMTVVVLWLGVFAILGDLAIVGPMFDQVKEFGKKTATSIGKLPYVAPILPQGMSLKKIRETIDPVYNLNKKVSEYENDDDSGSTANDLNEFNRSKVDWKDIEAIRTRQNFGPEEAKLIAREFKTSLDKMRKFSDRQLIDKFVKSGATKAQAEDLVKKLKKHWGSGDEDKKKDPKEAGSRAEAAESVKTPDTTTPTTRTTEVIAGDIADKEKLIESKKETLALHKKNIENFEARIKSGQLNDQQKNTVQESLDKEKASQKAAEENIETIKKELETLKKEKPVE